MTDANLLGGMTIEGFSDFSQFVEQPEQLGEGYELHRYFKNADGTYWDFDRVRYYPDPAGGRGYVYYAEGIGYSPAWNAGKWFRATPEGDLTMQRILQSFGVGAQAPTQPALLPALNQNWLIVLLIAALTGVLMVAGGVVRLGAKAANR